MPPRVLIVPLVLPPSEFPPLPLNPGFAALAADNLGDVATPVDGFDQVFADAASIVDSLDGALSVLGGDLLSAFGEADTIDAAPPTANVGAFAAALPASDAAVTALGNTLAAAAGQGGGGVGTPTPPAPPPPGGPGVGPGPPPTLPGTNPCTRYIYFHQDLPLPRAVTVLLVFQTGQGFARHTTGSALVLETPGAFRETHTFPHAITGGQKYSITVWQMTAQPAGNRGKFIIRDVNFGDVTAFCLMVGPGVNKDLTIPDGFG